MCSLPLHSGVIGMAATGNQFIGSSVGCHDNSAKVLGPYLLLVTPGPGWKVNVTLSRQHRAQATITVHPMQTRRDDMLTVSFGLIRSHRHHQHSCSCQTLGFALQERGRMSSQTLAGDRAGPLLSRDGWTFTSLQNLKDAM